MILVVNGLAIPGCLYAALVLDLELVVLHSRKSMYVHVLIDVCTYVGTHLWKY